MVNSGPCLCGWLARDAATTARCVLSLRSCLKCRRNSGPPRTGVAPFASEVLERCFRQITRLLDKVPKCLRHLA